MIVWKAILIICVSILSFADDDDEPSVTIEKLEAARAYAQRNASERIGELNYARMKLQSFSAVTRRIEESIYDLHGACDGAAFSENCVSKIEAIQVDVLAQLAKLKALEGSEALRGYQKSRTNQAIHVEDAFRDQRARLEAFVPQLADLRSAAGKRLVQLQFARAQKRVADDQKLFRNQAECMTGPPELESSLQKASIDLASAQAAKDPYLLSRVLTRAGRIKDRAAYLESSCKDIDLKVIESRAEKLAAAGATLPQYLTFTCAKMKKPELISGCDRGLANDEFLYSSHLALRGGP